MTTALCVQSLVKAENGGLETPYVAAGHTKHARMQIVRIFMFAITASDRAKPDAPIWAKNIDHER